MANVRNMGSVATLGTKSITANGTYNASADNVDGYSQVIVNVPEKTLGTKSIVANGTYNASADNVDGYSQVTVNVPEVINKMIPYASRKYNGWYISSQDYTYKLDASDPTAITISFPVEANHQYIIMTGTSVVFNRFRFGFASNDIVDSQIETLLTGYFETSDLNIVNKYHSPITAPLSGYLIGYIGLSDPDNGIICYLVDVTGVDMDGSIS